MRPLETSVALSAEEVRFEENGYVKAGRVLDDAQIAALCEGLEAIRSGRNPRISELYEIDEDYRRDPPAITVKAAGRARCSRACP